MTSAQTSSAIKSAIEKGGVPGAVIIAAWIFLSAARPLFDAQADTIARVIVAESESVTESIDELTRSQHESVSELTATVKELSQAVQAVTLQVGNIDTRLRDLETDDMPRIDRRVSRLEEGFRTP